LARPSVSPQEDLWELELLNFSGSWRDGNRNSERYGLPHQQWLKSAIKMMMGIGTPSRKSKIERMVRSPQIV
jgi:hypothetical protein